MLLSIELLIASLVLVIQVQSLSLLAFRKFDQ